MKLILVTGLSGSGKSIALDVLEDTGYYCVDNLPSMLLTEVVEYLQDSGYARIAVSVDVRSHRTLPELPRQIAALQHGGFDARVLFLETKTDTLVRRFSETRRRHPLSDDRLTLPECIQREREMLSEVYGIAHRIDTSDLSPNTLRNWIKGFVDVDRSRLTLLFQSFGFKHGLPLDADLVFDVRCLPNPHWDPGLRPLNGRDAPVIAFLEADPEVHRMYDDIRRFVENWLPCFVRDNRNYLTVALGCTGGQHRSVYLTERLSREFAYHGQVLVRHRELAG